MENGNTTSRQMSHVRPDVKMDLKLSLFNGSLDLPLSNNDTVSDDNKSSVPPEDTRRKRTHMMSEPVVHGMLPRSQRKSVISPESSADTAPPEPSANSAPPS